MLVYHDRDLEGRVLCEVIAELELVLMLKDPGLQTVLDARWNGNYDLRPRAFYASESTNFKILSGKTKGKNLGRILEKNKKTGVK